MLLVAGNMLPVPRQRVSLCIQQQRGNKQHVDGKRQHVARNMLPWCKRGLTELGHKLCSRYRSYDSPSHPFAEAHLSAWWLWPLNWFTGYSCDGHPSCHFWARPFRSRISSRHATDRHRPSFYNSPTYGGRGNNNYKHLKLQWQYWQTSTTVDTTGPQ